MQQIPSHYTLTIVDFNSELGHKQNDSETSMGFMGLGQEMIESKCCSTFYSKKKLYVTNSFLKKKSDLRENGHGHELPLQKTKGKGIQTSLESTTPLLNVTREPLEQRYIREKGDPIPRN